MAFLTHGLMDFVPTFKKHFKKNQEKIMTIFKKTNDGFLGS
jgi:hypothetical protein